MYAIIKVWEDYIPTRFNINSECVVVVKTTRVEAFAKVAELLANDIASYAIQGRAAEVFVATESLEYLVTDIYTKDFWVPNAIRSKIYATLEDDDNKALGYIVMPVKLAQKAANKA